MLKAVDFFCGSGGVSCGFHQAGIDVLGGIDSDALCRKTYEKNNRARFLQCDIEQLDYDDLKKEFSIKSEEDDLVFIGCSPCQYYTNLNTDKTKSDRGKMLLSVFGNFVEYFVPGYLFIENVPGIEKREESPLIDFKNKIKKLGYRYEDGVINMKHYGVPQNRRRYVLLASRVDKSVSLPEKEVSPLRTVRDAIGNDKNFPRLAAGETSTHDRLHTAAALSKVNLKRIRRTSHNGGDRRDWADNPELQVACYRNHAGHYDVYGRMRWKEVAPTITTRFNSYSNGRYGHPEQDRAISLREGAVLQTFPLDYHFYADNKCVVARMIGNAVPPEFARRVGERLLNG